MSLNSARQGKIGLALGGGAVLGAAHIGVIRAIEESSIQVNYVSGTSVGALIAALYAFGVRWDKMQEIAVDLDWLDITKLSLSQFGLLSNKKLGNVISKHLGDVTFSDAKIPLAIVATDIANGKKVVIRDGSIADAVMASSCIPGIFKPIENETQMLVDGGIMENVPIDPLQEMGAEFIIGVDLNAKQSFVRPKNILQVLDNTIHLTLLNITRLQTRQADLMITPDLSGFNYYKTTQVSSLILKVYQDGKQQIADALS